MNDNEIAQAFYYEYKRLAPGYGYEVEQVSWAEDTAENRDLMIEVVFNLRRRDVFA